jgi:hypothetical protein
MADLGIVQVTLNHMLPNFNECWWDSIILDVLICNWIGALLYLLVDEFFSLAYCPTNSGWLLCLCVCTLLFVVNF